MRPAILLGLGAVFLAVPAATAAAGPDDDGKLCELAHTDREKARSRACLSCHDGATFTADHAGLNAGQQGSHPFDVNYRSASMRRPSLRPQAMLPPELKLSSGTLTCATCHDGRSRAPHKLAMSNQHSALCFACHAF